MTITIEMWFIADTAKTKPYFPQVGNRSSTTEFKLVYWRCIAYFFANITIPMVNNFGIQNIFLKSGGGEVINFPITK